MNRAITMDERTAYAITDGPDSSVVIVADSVAMTIADAKLTPLQAEAVLVRAWGTVLDHCVLMRRSS